MKRLFALGLGLVLFELAGFSQAADVDEYAKKIVGIWEVTKSESDLPNGATVEFTKDGKLMVIIKDDMKLNGTYKLDKDKLNVKLTAGDQTIEETITITKLTDDALELKDKDKKVDVFKKKK
ncbi:MAG TPA: hypothetical protein VG122_08335 [Gemmata sp.]|jgi:uncharacterized protein (TIGR03066 family)|nr:hypothetical protein [Gemmata sp.]